TPADEHEKAFFPRGRPPAPRPRRILLNAQRVVAAELLCAAQGLEFLKPLTPGRGGAALYRRLRALPAPVLPLDGDRPPAPDLERLARAVASGELDPGAVAGTA